MLNNVYKYRLLNIYGLIVIILTIYVIFYTPINLTIVNLDFINIFIQFIIAIILALTIFLIERHKTKTKETYAGTFIYHRLWQMSYYIEAIRSNKPFVHIQDLGKSKVTGNASDLQKHMAFVHMKTFRSALHVFINILPNEEIIPLIEYFDRYITMYDVSNQDIQNIDWKSMYSEIVKHTIYWRKYLRYGGTRDNLSEYPNN